MTTYHMISLQTTMISPPTPHSVSIPAVSTSLSHLSPSSYCCPMQPLPPPPPPSHTSNSPFPLFSELTCGTWADADRYKPHKPCPAITEGNGREREGGGWSKYTQPIPAYQFTMRLVSACSASAPIKPAEHTM